MEKNVLVIEIQKPVGVVFRFTVNPLNTPKWIPSVFEEKTASPRVKVGTIYRQKGKNGKKSAIVVTGFIKNKLLDFHAVNKKYTCSYRYETIGSKTRLTYLEENGVNGKIKSPMSMKNLRMLKKLIEQS